MEKIPKILVISNNCFNSTKSNGKTLLSIFSRYPRDYIRQLYFKRETPEVHINSYYRITDYDMIYSFFGKKRMGDTPEANKNRDEGNAYYVSKNQGELKRYFREKIWREKIWKNCKFEHWLDEFQPELVFFMAGNSGFAYDICTYIVEKYKAFLYVYVTDDYFLKRTAQFSLFYEINRKKLIFQMKEILKLTRRFFTISEEMKDKYFDLFGRDSMLISNIQSFYVKQENKNSKNRSFNFLYAGSLYYGREKTLLCIVQTLFELCKDLDVNIIIDIYTNNRLDKKTEEKYKAIPIVHLHKPVSFDKIRLKLQECDIPIFVESFERKNIEKVRLSFSTKIPEYLSLGKCILGVGSSESASLKYLQGCAWCIDNKSSMKNELMELMENHEKRMEFSKKSLKRYEKLCKQNIDSYKMIKMICSEF